MWFGVADMWLAIGLLLVGLVAIIVEFFVPAGGLVGLAGLGSIIGSIVLVFINQGAMLGSIFLVIALIVVPLLIIVYFKVFPRTFIGRRLILKEVQEREGGYASYSAKMYSDLTGKEGLTLTVLRPSGRVLIDSRKYSVVTAGEFIEQGRPVKVVKVEGSRIVVREGG